MNQASADSNGNGTLKLVVGFQEPPGMIQLSEAKGERKRAINTRLKLLAGADIDAFGMEFQDRLDEAFAQLAQATAEINPETEADGVAQIRDLLASFEISHADIRANKSVWEKLRGHAAPLSRLLDKVEGIAAKFPKYGDPQDRMWKSLAIVYRKTCVHATDLANAIAAGRESMARANADLTPAHEKAMTKLPENRGQETDVALNALRKARDDIERQVHRLRADQKRTIAGLTAVRDLAASHQEMRRLRKIIDQQKLPEWENALAEVIQGASAAGTMPDLGPLQRATSALGTSYEDAETSAAAVAQAHQSALSSLKSIAPGSRE